MIQALLAEKDENWGLAHNKWQEALDLEELEIEHKLVCQGAILESQYRSWVIKSADSIDEAFIKQLEGWQESCQIQKQFESLCQAYLLRTRVDLARFRLDDVEKWLNLCLTTAKVANIKRYYDIAQKENQVFQQHKERILTVLEGEKPLTLKEQELRYQKYVKEALKSLEEIGSK